MNFWKLQSFKENDMGKYWEKTIIDVFLLIFKDYFYSTDAEHVYFFYRLVLL